MCLNELKSSTVFPRRSTRALISNFSLKDGRLFEGERLIEGALIKRTRERSTVVVPGKFSVFIKSVAIGQKLEDER